MRGKLTAESKTPPASAGTSPNAPETSSSQTVKNRKASKAERLIVGGTWLVAISLALFAGYLGWRIRSATTAAAAAPVAASEGSAPTAVQKALSASSDNGKAEMPDFIHSASVLAVSRLATLHTIIPTRPRQEVIVYTVSAGDSVFGIAQKFNLKPETILWANYDQLNDNPDMLSPGMQLNIPPVDGVYYQAKEGDTVQSVAAAFDAKPEEVLNWPGNRLDLTNPQIKAGSYVLVPGGHREFKQWIVPVIPRGRAGVSKSVYGPGACAGNYDGANGSGFFSWPTASHFLSGNDYWSGHLGIDIAGSVGDGVFAADSGVIVFAGWSTGGYGYMVMIDHGTTGYQTLYAHMSNFSVHCGQSVYQGQYIGALGNTGNSTGPHLHFEIRYLGGFVNPWYVLPAP